MVKDSKKEFICRACLKFLESEDFIDGACPICESDESIFVNNL